MYDDRNNRLLCCFENCKFSFSNLWIPQILNILVDKYKSKNKYIKKIVSKVIIFFLKINFFFLDIKITNLLISIKQVFLCIVLCTFLDWEILSARNVFDIKQNVLG